MIIYFLIDSIHVLIFLFLEFKSHDLVVENLWWFIMLSKLIFQTFDLFDCFHSIQEGFRHLFFIIRMMFEVGYYFFILRVDVFNDSPLFLSLAWDLVFGFSLLKISSIPRIKIAIPKYDKNIRIAKITCPMDREYNSAPWDDLTSLPSQSITK